MDSSGSGDEGVRFTWSGKGFAVIFSNRTASSRRPFEEKKVHKPSCLSARRRWNTCGASAGLLTL
jgi:hypothetical protein